MRTAGLDSSQGPTAAKYIVEKVKPQRIAIIHDKQQYGEGLARSVQDNLKKAGANIVFFDGITAGEKDFSALLARLKKRTLTSSTTAATTRKWARCCARRAPSG